MKRCGQDSNLRGKIPLYFESNALTTRPPQPWMFKILFFRFADFDQGLLKQNEPLRAGFEPARIFETKMKRCGQDSNLRGKIPLDFESNALTTRPPQPWVFKIASFPLCYFDQGLLKQKEALRAGFEPAREDPIGFRVQRLNHSATGTLDVRPYFF
ncbi:predicted protein [Nematostella vectensis]|uniref:Uncharacterized protein n=1 Tax=Nematostella vectensis TaxID=45351 RepID=A7T014_NEMVE|nr:predicted protein [Nematostella vectensis]|eukprot:XP_001622808.1 hypothetical protein NEMVEDRAFT_v1g220211 [Nematostella vectensis]